MKVKVKPDAYLQILDKEFEGKKYHAGQILVTDKDYQDNDKSEIVEVSFKPEQYTKFEALKKAGGELCISIRRNPKTGSSSYNLVA